MAAQLLEIGVEIKDSSSGSSLRRIYPEINLNWNQLIVLLESEKLL